MLDDEEEVVQIYNMMMGNNLLLLEEGGLQLGNMGDGSLEVTPMIHVYHKVQVVI